MRSRLIVSALWCAVVCRGADQPGYWIDPDTHLTWTAADNGSGVSWLQAQRYCRNLTLDGFHDWVLPSIDELQGIVAAENQGAYRVKAPIKLTGWQWSSTPGKQHGEGWALDFGDGGRASVAAGDSGLNRALCVRQRHRKINSQKKEEIDGSGTAGKNSAASTKSSAVGADRR